MLFRRSYANPPVVAAFELTVPIRVLAPEAMSISKSARLLSTAIKRPCAELTAVHARAAAAAARRKVCGCIVGSPPLNQAHGPEYTIIKGPRAIAHRRNTGPRVLARSVARQ